MCRIIVNRVPLDLDTAYRFHDYTLVANRHDYLMRIVKDAYAAENRPCTNRELDRFFTIYCIGNKEYCGWDGNSSDYARVIRRVEYRLNNNKWIDKLSIPIRIDHVFNNYGYLDHDEYSTWIAVE